MSPVDTMDAAAGTAGITVNKLGAACGAEIVGVDASKPVDDRTIAAVRQAWLDNLMIVLRGQDLGPDDQKRFCGYLGEVGAYHRPRERQNPNYASDTVMLVSNIRENGKPIGALPDGEMMWHSDTAYNERPHMATTLFAVEIPATGGNTLFANQYMAYDAVPAALKARLKGKCGMNAYEFGTTQKAELRYEREKVPHFLHPIFRRHPETGRTALYVNELMTEEIEGIPEAEGRAILQELFAIQCRPEFVYEHRWRPGDFVIWDNRCSLHARTDFPPDQRRLLRRITIEDKWPVMMAD